MGWQRTDDFDPKTPADQVTFGLQGKAYVLDLGPENQRKLADLLQRYLTVAVEYGDLPQPPEFPVASAKPAGEAIVPVQSSSSSRTRKRTPAKKVAASNGVAAPNGNGAVPHATIRSWAGDHGYSVTPKGRIPDAVIRAYDEAHAGVTV